ncbi:MAG TPA: isoprenylcysteine carboxylmethyltransferase family protein [Ignavibacteriales bacterium]|nr:isoprenylcysteine carboxylmethyltransferase family protein [Ignavibacteriales bacterium]
MNEIVFKIIFATLFAIYIVIRGPYDKEYKQIEKIKTLNSLTDKCLLILMTIGLLLMPLIWLLTPFLNDFKIEFPDWFRIVGILISIISLFYFRRIHKTLGTSWSPTLEITKRHQLIQIGVYKRIRHPMYLQMLIWAIAQCLIISNYIAGFSGLMVWIIFYFIRVPKEEEMMTDYFGEKYIKYKKQTGSIFPNIKNSNLLT